MLAAEVWRWVAQSSWGGHSRYITLQHSIRLQACHVGCWPSFCGRGSGVAVSVHCQIPHKPGWINSVIFSAPPPLPLTITPPPPPRSNHRPFFPRVQCCQPHVQRHITLCAINYCHCKAFFFALLEVELWSAASGAAAAEFLLLSCQVCLWWLLGKQRDLTQEFNFDWERKPSWY